MALFWHWQGRFLAPSTHRVLEHLSRFLSQADGQSDKLDSHGVHAHGYIHQSLSPLSSNDDKNTSPSSSASTDNAQNISQLNGRRQSAEPKPNDQQGSGNLQNQHKRQKEWIYLCHYIAISGLNPLHIISGQDDGHEPDFTLIFYQQSRLYYVGVELTTLPRLRDQMDDKGLIAKRWYWQGLQIMAKHRQKIPSFQRFKWPVQSIYMPLDDYGQRLRKLPYSIISQADIDAVMQKKAHKVPSYHDRRALDELWLLIHTDKYQPDSILTRAKKPLGLCHASGFDQVQVTRYPSHKIINVIKANGRHTPKLNL